MPSHVRCLSMLVLFVLPVGLFAQELPTPAATTQIQDRMQQLLNENPHVARQMAESAARNGGVVRIEELDSEAVALLRQVVPASQVGSGIAASRMAPPLAEKPQPRPLAQVHQQAKLRQVLEKHPEVLVALIRGAASSAPDGDNNEIVEQSHRAILSLGSAVVPAMLKLLEHDDAKMRQAATAFLAYAAMDESGDYPAETVLPALVKVAEHDADPGVQSAARMHLGLLVSLLANDDYRRNMSRQFKAPLAVVPE